MGHGFPLPLGLLGALGRLPLGPVCPCCFSISTPEATPLKRKHRYFWLLHSRSYLLAPEGLLPAKHCARRKAEDVSRAGRPRLCIEGEQNTPPQNMPRRHVDSFELKTVKAQQTQEGLFPFLPLKGLARGKRCVIVCHYC